MTSSVEKQTKNSRENTAEDITKDHKDEQGGLKSRPRIPEVSAERLEELREQSPLKHLRISANADEDINLDNDNNEGLTSLNISAKSTENTTPIGGSGDDESVLMLTAENQMKPSRPFASKLLGHVATALSVLWLVYGFAFMGLNYGLSGILEMAPPELGGMLAGVLAPVALMWMVIGYVQRNNDIEHYSSALREELQSIIFPSEERAERVSKDIERLCRQAAELSTSSKSVIKAISRARQGLRSEVRDFVGISKKTEFHIDRLADSLHDRAQKLVVLTEEIEQRTANIDEKTQAGADAWDEATLHVLERAAEMETAMGRGTDKLLDAATEVEIKTKSIEEHLTSSYESMNESVDAVAKRLQDLSSDFDLHTQGLSKAADHVSEETTRLADTIERQIGSLEDVASNTLEAMSKSTQQIQDHREMLDKAADDVAGQADRIADTINTSLSGLHDAADYMVTRTEDLEERLDSQTDKLRETVSSITKEAEQIEEAGVSAGNKLSEAMSVALAGAESISAAVRRSIESLEKTTQSAREQADEMIVSTRTHIEELGEAGEGNLNHIKDILELMSKSREQIEEAASLSDAQVEKLSEAVDVQSEKIKVTTASIVERIENVEKALSMPLREMKSAIAEADSRHSQIEEVLGRRVDDLRDASDKAHGTATDIRNMLRAQAQEISSLSGQISGHARTINEQMGDSKSEFNQSVIQSLAKIEDVQTALDKQAKFLTNLSDGAVDDISRLEGQISGRCNEVSASTKDLIEDIVRLQETIDRSGDTIDTRSERATTAIRNVSEALEETAEGFQPIFSGAMDQATEVQAKFEALHDDFSESTESNLQRLREIGVLFDDRLQSLGDGADKAAMILKSSSEDMQARVLDIERAATSASERMSDIEDSLRDQSSEIHLVTDQALLKIENIQQVINEQFHELSESVGQALTRIADVGEDLGKSVQHIDDVTEHAVNRFGMVGEKAREEGDSLNVAAAKVVTMTDEMIVKLKQDSDQLLNASKETLYELRKSGDSFEMKAREVGEQMNASLRASQDYTSELKKQATVVAEVSQDSVDQISKSLVVLEDRLGDIREAANDTASGIETSRSSLAEESDRLLTVSAQAIKAADEATQAFSKQSSSLFKAVQDAAYHTEKIRKEEWRAQRNAFMASAKFIIESLHSLSVDLTRVKDGEISEKVWKSYQKGDVAAFTQRLAALSDEMPMDKLRDKFSSDSEFRSYVQRYTRQYEEVYEQAIANDHGDLLGATFVTSDIGKLYELLCKISGKDSVVNDGERKAA